MILVDTSAWIAFFKKEPGSERLRNALRTGEVVTCETILFELLPALAVRPNSEALIRHLETIVVLDHTADWNWIRSGQARRVTEGKRLIGLADWFVLDCARRHGVRVLTLDAAMAAAAMDSSIPLA